MDVDWYKTFFRGVALDLWRQVAAPEQTRAEADFLDRALGLQPGARVLDVPCGLGRHAIELAARGFRVSGVDLSDEAIAAARETGAGAGTTVEWVRADMRDLPWEAEFDGAFCFGNSFGYLGPAGTRSFVKAVSRALRPGARFALDGGMAAESVLPNLREREWAAIGDILFLEENRYLVEEGCLETRYTFVRDGEVSTRTGLHWVFTLREIRELLADARFVVEGAYNSLAGEPFTVGSPYLVLVARKEPGEVSNTAATSHKDGSTAPLHAPDGAQDHP